MRAGPLVVAEPVEDVSIVEGVEAVAGTADRPEGEVDELVGGEGSVLVEKVEQECSAMVEVCTVT